MSELLAPLLRKRCSILMYPCKVRSSIARFTVEGGQTQILRNSSYGRPALTVRICSVYEVHIHMDSTARKVVAVNGIEIIHLVPPS